MSVGTVAAEIQLASLDNVLATNVTATLLAAEGVYVDRRRQPLNINNVTNYDQK